MTTHQGPTIIMPLVRGDPSKSNPELTELIDALWQRTAAEVEAAGGRVERLEEADPSRIRQLAESCDALLLPGGGDVDPSLYGDPQRHPELYNVDIDADRAAIEIAREARRAGLPILAVCRGLHILNVAHGGTLVQHMPPSSVVHRGGPGEAMVDHPVHLDESSTLARLLEKRELTVRSGHHQAVSRLGEGLHVVGRTVDGCVEALEGRDIIAVQWHPEDASADREDAEKLFAWLVSAATRRKESRARQKNATPRPPSSEDPK